MNFYLCNYEPPVSNLQPMPHYNRSGKTSLSAIKIIMLTLRCQFWQLKLLIEFDIIKMSIEHSHWVANNFPKFCKCNKSKAKSEPAEMLTAVWSSLGSIPTFLALVPIQGTKSIL